MPQQQFKTNRPFEGVPQLPYKRVVSSEETDSPSKQISDQPIGQQPSAAALVKIIPASQLQDMAIALLEHPVAGPIWTNQLHAKLLATSKIKYLRIRDDARLDYCILRERALVKSAGVDRLVFSTRMSKSIADVEELNALGSNTKGPRYAWKALIHLANLSILRDGDTRACGKETDCDTIHDRFELILLRLAIDLRQSDPSWFSKSKRIVEVQGIRVKPRMELHFWASRDHVVGIGRRDYRYKVLLKYLVTGNVLLEEIDCGKTLQAPDPSLMCTKEGRRLRGWRAGLLRRSLLNEIEARLKQGSKQDLNNHNYHGAPIGRVEECHSGASGLPVKIEANLMPSTSHIRTEFTANGGASLRSNSTAERMPKCIAASDLPGTSTIERRKDDRRIIVTSPLKRKNRQSEPLSTRKTSSALILGGRPFEGLNRRCPVKRQRLSWTGGSTSGSMNAIKDNVVVLENFNDSD